MTIAEVSKKFGLSPDTLRYYERKRQTQPTWNRSKIYRIISHKNTKEGDYLYDQSRTAGTMVNPDSRI
ncbi:MerR family regulatory protein [Moorella thermoacetica]|nr:MerR family DNA-binding transcriptional regulator [Moorella thermoacetica]OIQ10384.1 MerR family regulatory protein [Moorella thermoacetica]